MLAVGIKTLKNRLSEYVRRVVQGEVVLVTDHDRVVAELRAPGPERAGVVSDALLLNLMREGLIVQACITDGSPPPRKPVMKIREVLGGLAEDRGER